MTALSANVRGAALMVASMAGFAINDALVKTLADTMPVYQVMFLRGLFASAFLFLLAWRAGALWPTVTPADHKRIIWRTLSEIGATSFFLSAVFNMPLANATAILQTLPLAVTLGAAIFLREQVGWRRYSAILVGFAGVLIIFRPGTEGFNAYSVSALVAVAFIVVRDLTTRGLSTGVPSLFVALVSAIAITVAGGLASLTLEWRPVGTNDLIRPGCAAVFLIGGYLFAVMTMRVGEISFVSPFRYTVLLWAMLLGYLVFGEEPDAWMLTGSTIVVAMGIYTFYRERKVASATEH